MARPRVEGQSLIDHPKTTWVIYVFIPGEFGEVDRRKVVANTAALAIQRSSPASNASLGS
jgi:hypothetical protein